MVWWQATTDQAWQVGQQHYSRHFIRCVLQTKKCAEPGEDTCNSEKVLCCCGVLDYWYLGECNGAFGRTRNMMEWWQPAKVKHGTSEQHHYQKQTCHVWANIQA
jgi:hypothetical protein